MMRRLIISIGLRGRETTPMAGLIISVKKSIEHAQPDEIIFVVSRESKQFPLPSIIERLGMQSYEAKSGYRVIELEDAGDLGKCHTQLFPKFEEVTQGCDYLVVDATSGTKVMCSLLVLYSVLFGADELVYVAGKRSGGVVLSGVEQVYSVDPTFLKKGPSTPAPEKCTSGESAPKEL